jgi:hypothetical protein
MHHLNLRFQPTYQTSRDPGLTHPANDEEAARQQGDLFFWENSSNGGKAIGTFWGHTMSAKMQCQGENLRPATKTE